MNNSESSAFDINIPELSEVDGDDYEWDGIEDENIDTTVPESEADEVKEIEAEEVETKGSGDEETGELKEPEELDVHTEESYISEDSSENENECCGESLDINEENVHKDIGHQVSSKGRDISIDVLIKSSPPRTVLAEVMKLRG